MFHMEHPRSATRIEPGKCDVCEERRYFLATVVLPNLPPGRAAICTVCCGGIRDAAVRPLPVEQALIDDAVRIADAVRPAGRKNQS